ncbi:MAG: phosphatidylserine decarboxylase [Rickettsiales bacterium]
MSVLTRIAKNVEEFFVPIHREGILPASIAFAVTAICFTFSDELGFVLLVLACWTLYFFRNPKRTTPVRPGLVIAPGDGRIVDVSFAAPPPELGMGAEMRRKISIFLNVCDVHVNRVPISGVVTVSHYRPGKFLNADLDKASEDNERQCLLIKEEKGREIACVQIAGLVARRIVCEAKVGDVVEAGARYGIIRFGSRVDVYLPPEIAPMVCKGQYMIGGETVMADLDAERQEEAVGRES